MKSIPATDAIPPGKVPIEVDHAWLAWAVEAARMALEVEDPDTAEEILARVGGGETHAPCPMLCGDHWCLIHDVHWSECDCPGLDEEV